jgi:hypothetical protein
METYDKHRSYYAPWKKKAQGEGEELPFRARCPECGVMQHATRVFARALRRSSEDGSQLAFDCGHSTGYTYAQLSARSPIYILLAEEVHT